MMAAMANPIIFFILSTTLQVNQFLLSDLSIAPRGYKTLKEGG
jgi:hypothetical protein